MDYPDARVASAEQVEVMQVRASSVDVTTVTAGEPELFAAWHAGMLRPWRVAAAFNGACA